MKFAGRLLDRLVQSQPAQQAAAMGTRLVQAEPSQRFLARGGREMLVSSIPGAVLTGGLSGLMTGNPLVGLTVGGLDLATSAGIGRALGSKTLAQGLEKAGMGKVAPKLAGRYETVIPEGGKPTRQYSPSSAQQVAMGAANLGTALVAAPALESLLAGNAISQLSQEQIKQLIAEPVAMDKTTTEEQQMLQRQLLNDLEQQSLAPGTMFQMQGVESTLTRPVMGPMML